MTNRNNRKNPTSNRFFALAAALLWLGVGCTSLVKADRSKVPDDLYQPTPGTGGTMGGTGGAGAGDAGTGGTDGASDATGGDAVDAPAGDAPAADAPAADAPAGDTLLGDVGLPDLLGDSSVDGG
jgi:hypothetical protein